MRTAGSSGSERTPSTTWGAYLRTHGTVVPGLSAGMLPGPYEMTAYRCRMRCVLTNKTPTGTYRAPGRFECNAARERLIDRAARLMGIEPSELRMRNLIRPEQMPYARGTTILGEEVSYDSGDYPAALSEAVALSGFPTRGPGPSLDGGRVAERSGTAVELVQPSASGTGGAAGTGTSGGSAFHADIASDADPSRTPMAGPAASPQEGVPRRGDGFPGSAGILPAQPTGGSPVRRRMEARASGGPALEGLSRQSGEGIDVLRGSRTDAGPTAGTGHGTRFRRGMGLACFVEKTGTGPFEGARAFLDRGGALVIATGACDLGQGIETCLAQIAGDALGVEHAGVTVRHGDTDLIPRGVGSFASRGTVMAGNAVHAAVRELRGRVLERAAARLETAAADLVIEARGLVRGPDGRSCTLADLAAEPGLEALNYFRCEQMAYSHGVTVARVLVDTATGHVVPERIWVLYDVGRVVNPAIVAGQIEGGVAQGLGGALLEELRYDDTGQLLTGSFMDYLLPGATDMPSIVHRDLGGSPSPRNPLGVKGAGEVGIAGIGGAIANAVADALGDAEGGSDGLPLTPERVFERARAGRASEVPAGVNPGVKRGGRPHEARSLRLPRPPIRSTRCSPSSPSTETTRSSSRAARASARC